MTLCQVSIVHNDNVLGTSHPKLHYVRDKLDGVGPVDNRSSNNKLHHLKNHTWHVTCDMWHVTRDMWLMTWDTRQVTCDTWREVNFLSKFQVPTSYGLEMKVCWRFEGKGWFNELIYHGGVCRTAPATPGLLINFISWMTLCQISMIPTILL